MRTLLCILLLFTGISFGQKTPVGLIIKFSDNASFAEKQDVIRQIEFLEPLQQEHDLIGFDVTVVEGAGEYNEDQYRSMRADIEVYDLVEFTSTFFRTDEGGYGGDLPEMYVKSKEGPIPTHALDEMNAINVAYHHYLEDVLVFTFSKDSKDIRQAQEELLSSGKFDFVSVNTFHSVLATSDDPYFEKQWALENVGGPIHFDGTPGADMSVTEAWDISSGDPSIKIAVLDSGTDTNHVDLVGNLLPGFDATGGDTRGYPNTTYPNDGHGTCCAGIIGAVGNNFEGIAGVAYDCKIIPVRIFYYIEFFGDIIPFTTSEAGQDGIIWAVNTAGADVLSNSWGIRDSDVPLLGIDTVMGNMIIADNVANGRDGRGTPMLFSSGNEGDDFSIWPAAHPKTISVGASTMCDELKDPGDCSPEGWWGSNYGENLDVTAPGVKVLSTDMSDELGYNGYVDNDYSMFNGTSAACPNAAGVMALILSVDPELSSFDARAILSITADQTGGYAYDTPSDFGMWSDEMGYGRVNAYEAVNYASNFVGLETESASVKDWIGYNHGNTSVFLGETENTTVVIYSILGVELARMNAEEISSNEIRLNDWVTTSGMYLVQVNREADQVFKAFVEK